MAREMIRPVSALRDDFADVSNTVHETGRPVFLTKDGYGDMVVLSMEAYERLRLDGQIYAALLEAEHEAESTDVRFSPQDALREMRHALEGVDE
ncbi:type II toxin-antitoxin system Phd/YefM family antitoxin [Bifidobacterium pullorum subsp. saeculare]|uniref:Antitoxin n=1 Tax=Bifidobacterium pullorum subsp. saeculare TaxID=78257 RepID=A0A938WW49_9BIFI|nr:type II toxin-antitoxin system Phd/YefM family antitoxin [Bifidobacterium pullorum]MBM6699339.1 type II toxin-antitoxin system Phd/YefM family antitoxin [Bifidobacterium pullorum subsp. saeculare]